MTLAEFLAARLDEDEAAAKAAAHGNDGRWVLQGHPSESAIIWDSNGSAVVYDEGSPTEAEAAHIALHDPNRELREVEAGRTILAAYGAVLRDCESVGDPARRPRLYGEHDGLHMAVTHLAAVYSDHPDYRQEWKP